MKEKLMRVSSLDDAATKGQQEIASKYGGLRWCSFANSAMPKANTRWRHRANPAIPCLLRFNHLRDPTGLARQVRLLMAGTNSKKAGIPKLKLERSGAYMFDGKNNRILDSFSFRLALTAAVFAAWSGAGYVLLYLA